MAKRFSDSAVEEAVKMFPAKADGLDATDPVEAMRVYFETHASEDLKARVKASGKTPEMCWDFVFAYARKILGGRNGHIDPRVVYAVAMHFWEDVELVETDVQKPSTEAQKTQEATPAKPKKDKPKKGANEKKADVKPKPDARKAARRAEPAKTEKPDGGQAFFDFGE